MRISIENIKKAQEQNLWNFGNQVLYNMCQKAPHHINEDEIIGKVWLIGRSYATAVERGASSSYSGDKFYQYEVAGKIKAVGSELDNRIAFLRRQARITEELLVQIVETHGFLTKVFHDISGKEKRSLASKYLHFHAPDIFYIYDSRAINGVTKFKTLDSTLKKSLLKSDCDNAYADFLAKMYPLNIRIYREYDVWLTPRQLDAML